MGHCHTAHILMKETIYLPKLNNNMCIVIQQKYCTLAQYAKPGKRTTVPLKFLGFNSPHEFRKLHLMIKNNVKTKNSSYQGKKLHEPNE